MIKRKKWAQKCRGFMAALAAVMGFLSFSAGLTAYAAQETTDPAPVKKDKEAVMILPEISCDDLPGEKFRQIVDDYYYTSFKTKTKLRLKCRTKKPVTGIYFMFEMPCHWTLTLPDGTVKQGGENGYLHEFIETDAPVTAFFVDLPAKARITDVYAFTEGALPEWVQRWEPPCESADLLLLPTHADDELLWFGGALPYYAGELGYKVQVVYLTNHYNYSFRGHELLNGLWKMGVRHYPVINEAFTDVSEAKDSLKAAKDIYGYNNVLAFQVETLRRFAPKVVIGHATNGEYGHGAHKLNASTLRKALTVYDDPAVYPESAEKYGTRRIGKCYLHLWQENVVTVTWSEKKLSKFGGKTALEMAKEGYLCHDSQQKCPFKVKESGECDCRLFGLVYTTVGYDTPGVNDLFEHIDMADEGEGEDNDGRISDTDLSSSVVQPADKGSGSFFEKPWVWAVFAAAGAVTVLGLTVFFAVKTKKGDSTNES